MTIAQNLTTNRFPVRRMDFDFSAVDRYWFKGDAGLTHFMTALSTLFPVGERFFVDAVRAVRYHEAIKDNVDLQAQISAFIGQEAMHSKEHHAMNRHAEQFGYEDIEWMEKTTGTVLSARNIFKTVPQDGNGQSGSDLCLGALYRATRRASDEAS